MEIVEQESVAMLFRTAQQTTLHVRLTKLVRDVVMEYAKILLISFSVHSLLHLSMLVKVIKIVKEYGHILFVKKDYVLELTRIHSLE